MRKVRVPVPVPLRVVLLIVALVATSVPVAAVLAGPAAAVAGLTATFRQQFTWPNGYTATYTIANATGAAVTGWTVEFDLPGGTTIGNLWEGSVTRTGDQLSIVKGEWELKFRVNDDPTVADESAGLAGRIAGLEPDEYAALAACTRRVEVWSDTQDPFVEHLTDFGAAVEVLKTFRGLTAIDPKDHALM